MIPKLLPGLWMVINWIQVQLSYLISSVFDTNISFLITCDVTRTINLLKAMTLTVLSMLYHTLMITFCLFQFIDKHYILLHIFFHCSCILIPSQTMLSVCEEVGRCSYAQQFALKFVLQSLLICYLTWWCHKPNLRYR